MGRRKGGRRVKRRTHVGSSEAVGPNTAAKNVVGSGAQSEKKVPKSIVVRHGKSGKHVTQLVEDLRGVMMPYTAKKLKERKNASMRDYTAVAAPLGVSHLMVVQQGARAPNLKVARMPHGPTVSFRIEAYALSRQIRAAQKKVYDITAALLNPPLVVLNNFEESVLQNKRHLKIASLTFQSLFPSINVRTVKLATCNRVLLLHLNEEDDTIEFRHYLVRTRAHGASRLIKRVLKSSVPNLGTAEDISEILHHRSTSAGYATSDSEFEDEDSKIKAPVKQSRSQGQQKSHQQSASLNQSVVQLTEVGPRLKLLVYKVEDGLFTGEVQYHAFQEKTKEEILALREHHKAQKELLEERKAKQQENVERKRKAQQEKSEKKKAKRIKTSTAAEMESDRFEQGHDGDEEESDQDDEVSLDE